MTTDQRFLRPRDRSFKTAPPTAALTALVFAILAMPATAGTMQVGGIGVFNATCQPPVGSPPRRAPLINSMGFPAAKASASRVYSPTHTIETFTQREFQRMPPLALT